MAKEQEGSKALEVTPDGATGSANDVLQEVVQMTGLPEEYLNSELSECLGTAGAVNEMSVEQLRAALLNYLETLNDEMNQTYAPHN